ncbi:MAG: hypothetical protein AAFV85_23240 [Cyanobacteria bacterium J06634_6]
MSTLYSDGTAHARGTRLISVVVVLAAVRIPWLLGEPKLRPQCRLERPTADLLRLHLMG